MFKNIFKFLLLCCGLFLLTGCSTGMVKASPERSALVKEFNNPPEGKAGLYLYKHTAGSFRSPGEALRTAYLDDQAIAKLKQYYFIYMDVEPGEHTISVESEFSPNKLKILFEKGKNYFVRQYLKIGIFVNGSNVVLMDEEKAKKALKDDDYILVEFRK
ncbi:DUF2846 domain-containing protein [uncultured Campylobacter sp.]|uniref:DUF2846 domain-containing protein n=1 Tax=uncultured Campylobacter sp. TaxID=218934 RepID=UPI002615717B|nr:DUF2846 domain-containing protein [uncultured Campylobacter sp.]